MFKSKSQRLHKSLTEIFSYIGFTIIPLENDKKFYYLKVRKENTFLVSSFRISVDSTQRDVLKIAFAFECINDMGQKDFREKRYLITSNPDLNILVYNLQTSIEICRGV